MKKLSDEIQSTLDEKLRSMQATKQTETHSPMEKTLHLSLMETLEYDLHKLRSFKLQALKLEAMTDCNPTIL